MVEEARARGRPVLRSPTTGGGQQQQQATRVFLSKCGFRPAGEREEEAAVAAMVLQVTEEEDH